MNEFFHSYFSPQFSPRLSTGVWRWTLTMIIIIDSLVIIIILSVTLRVMPADLITINSPHGTPHRDLWLSVVCTYQLRVWGRRERETALPPPRQDNSNSLLPPEEARQQGRGRGREVWVGEEAGQTLRPSEGHRRARTSQDCRDPGEIWSGGRWELKIF